MIECQHGSIREKCEICERDADIIRLKRVLLSAHFYFVNGSHVLGLNAIKDGLTNLGLVEDDGVTWTEEAITIGRSAYESEECK